MALTNGIIRRSIVRIAVAAVAASVASAALGGGQVANAATTVYPEHQYYLNCSGTLLDTGLKGPFVSVTPVSLKLWPGLDETVIDLSGAFHPWYSGEYVYYRAFVQWQEAGGWHIRYAGQDGPDKGATAPTLDGGLFQYRATENFPSVLEQWIAGPTAQGHWENYGGAGLNLADMSSLYPQAQFGESWVPLSPTAPTGTKYWVGVQTVWSQVLQSNTGYGIAGLPAATYDYLTTGTSAPAGTLPPLNCTN
ncbi:MAG: hypothetical protein E6I86_04925 [Chloroflexi bacterium]|nr:MAG: hypothetical protein E6I86_04925 [Chloroflexota bacterium]